MLFTRLLKGRIRHGALTIIDAAGRRHSLTGSNPGPRATIRITDPRLDWRMAAYPHLVVGEAYMDGTLRMEEGSIRDFMDVIGHNLHHIETHPFLRAAQRLQRPFRWIQQFNPMTRAKRNVAHHYDLSGRLYDLFLDDDRQYSCAYFATPQDSLEQAQENKKRLLAGKLMLQAGLRVLDIGCGWGGLALHLARHHNVQVVGITLSEEQLKIARQRAKDAGLDDKVTFRLQDYRNLNETFDRVVSVGMLEHVGSTHLGKYFARVRDLLRPDGIAVIHSIGRMEPPGTTNPWLRKYIFPGGYTPALSEAMAAVERAALYVTDVEILRLHYARTLAEWTRRFQANRDKAAAIYDERFCRMWEFYLMGCEMAFRHWNQMVFQVQLTRKQEAVPLTRDYLLESLPGPCGTGSAEPLPLRHAAQ